jgi:hypothetical protein
LKKIKLKKYMEITDFINDFNSTESFNVLVEVGYDEHGFYDLNFFEKPIKKQKVKKLSWLQKTVKRLFKL